jgi:hypothetical protein
MSLRGDKAFNDNVIFITGFILLANYKVAIFMLYLLLKPD